MEINLKDQLIELELHLLKPEVRASEQELDRILSDNFLEFGGSGKSFRKAEAITRLPTEVAPKFTAEGFELRELGPNVAQLIYKATIMRPGEEIILYSLRSSIWQKNNNTWQMIFHQGTPCEPF